MASVLIDLPSQQVWDALSDLTRHVEWSAHVKTEAVGDGPLAVGSKFTSALPDTEPDQLTVTELEPNSKIVYHSVMRTGLEFDFTMTFEARGDSTYVTRQGKLVKGPIYLKPLVNLVVGPMGEGKYLKVIKEALERPQS